jgi:hypothetical protein
MAEGAGLPLQRLAEWSYIEECEAKRCSAAVGLFDKMLSANSKLWRQESKARDTGLSKRLFQEPLDATLQVESGSSSDIL